MVLLENEEKEQYYINKKKKGTVTTGLPKEIVRIIEIYLSLHDLEIIFSKNAYTKYKRYGRKNNTPFAELTSELNKIWKLSDSETNKHLEAVKNVRNQLAHTLNTNHIYHNHTEGKKSWKRDWKGFGEILEKCWSELSDVYQGIWDQKELAEYILDQLKEIHKENKSD